MESTSQQIKDQDTSQQPTRGLPTVGSQREEKLLGKEGFPWLACLEPLIADAPLGEIIRSESQEKHSQAPSSSRRLLG